MAEVVNHSESEAIAIVGIGCKVPGADNIRDFWRVLLHGENHIVEIPPSRWNADAYYDPDPMAPGKTYVKRAGLVSGSDEFDNKVYGINDFEAAQMDPQQRFVLDCTLMALEDAGLTRKHMAGSRTGVFLGAMNADYRGLFTANSSNVGNYTVTGISNSIIAARLSYVFDLRGPSLVLDTACSSSLIGIHLGCQAIRAGDCDMAIAGGTNYLSLPDVFVHLSKAGMISPTGQCHSFSNKADGYTRGEGCGIVILKKLRDAERDGDKIWATIHTGSNQDGHSVTPITAPSGLQQACLLDHVFSRMGLDLSRIDYIEAHGTGTNAGDPVEVNTLGEFFKTKATPRKRYMGSVKTNIGHLESAAGVVGVIKVLLMMKNNKIVPSLHCDEPNPKINFPDLMLTVPGQPVDWNNPDKVSCCNSFGFGGSNSHAVLCDYTKKDKPSDEIVSVAKVRRPCIVAFSACTEKSLRGILETVYTDPQLTHLSVHDIAYTSTARRDHYPIRVAVVVEDIYDLITVLEEEIARPKFPAGVQRKPRLTFVFCGMGTAWVGMCKELVQHVPVFRQTLTQVDEELKQYVDWSLCDRLTHGTHFNDPVFSPIAIFACQVALTAVWRDLGLEPRCIVGQSVGEVAAAYAAGCISLPDAVKIVYHRSHLLSTVTGGKMVIVRNVNVDKTRHVINKYQGKASISLQYSPNSCCISADSDVMPQIRTDLLSSLRSENKGVQLVDLDVPVAYHSHHVDPCRAPLAAALEGLVAHPPTVPLVSSVTGEMVTEAPGVDYWVDNLRQPVLFHLAVMNARDPKHAPVFLEIGPKPVLRAHLPDIFPKEEVGCVMSMSKAPEYKLFLQSLVALYGHGANIHWHRLPTLGTRVTDIPRYVFDKKKNLSNSETGALLLSGVDERRRNHPYAFPLQNSAGFKLIITPLGLKSIYDHIISGRIVIPGAFYAESGFAIAKHFSSCSRRKVAVSVDFEQAMTVNKDAILEISIVFSEDVEPAARWKAPIRIMKDNRLLAHLRISETMADLTPPDVINLDSLRARCPNEISKEAIYSALRSAGFYYGETFCLLESAYTNKDECCATLKVHKNVMEEIPGTTIHPSILDCMLQSSLVITSGDGGQKDLLPKALGRVVVHGPMEPVMVVYTRIKVRGSKQNLYDLKLLSTSGYVIAELDGLVINLIMETQENAIPDMFTNEWSPVATLPTSPSPSSSSSSPPGTPLPAEDPEVLYLCDRPLEGEGVGEKGAVVVVLEGMDFTKGLPKVVHEAIVAHKKAAALVMLLESQGLADDVDADAMDGRIINWCFLYKEVMLLVNNMSLTLPVYLLTCNAWPALFPARCDLPVNPVATSLWGVYRTIQRERIYPFTMCAELQVPPPQLTLPFLHRTLLAAINDNRLKGHSEILVTPDEVYISLVGMVDPDTPVPLFRSNTVSRDKSAILLSSESSALVKPVVVLHDVTSSTSGKEEKEMTHLNVQAYALQSTSLLQLKMHYERLDHRSNASKANGYTVFAIETVGTPIPYSSTPTTHTGRNSAEIPGVPMVACYPVAMGTQVMVPTCATLRSHLLPGYQPGDLAKLVLLLELQRKVETPKVTVLTSNATRQYAGILQGMLAGRKCGKVPYVVQMLQAEQLWRRGAGAGGGGGGAPQRGNGLPPLHDTLVSLVRLDANAVTSLTSCWNNATTLITFNSLVDAEALSCAYCFCPDLQVVMLDTRLLFQPAALKKSVPEVAKWIKRQATGSGSGSGSGGGAGSSSMSKVMAALHADLSSSSLFSPGSDSSEARDEGVILNLADLLKFRRSEVSHLEVQVNKDELFRKDSVYIVVGGLSGLGWICVQYLAEKGAGCIAIFNRRSPSQEQQSSMQNLSVRHSCHVQAFQCDVTSRSSVLKAFQEIKTAFPAAELKGVFFGAAVTEDKSFLGMDVASFDKALSPKVRGAWNLHQLTQDLDLDYFLLHSSVVSVVGNSGQSNYSAGNAFMDGLAHRRRHRGLSAQAVNWGALDTGLLDSNDMARQILESQGFIFMSPQEIRNALTPILMLNWPQCCPLNFDREVMSQRLNREGIVPLRNRMKKILVSTEFHSEIEEDLIHEVRAAKHYEEADKRLAVYENYARKLAARVLSVDVGSITSDVTLVDLGMDSIVAMTMINQIHRDTARRLPAVVFVTGEPTVVSIAEAIDEALEDGTEGSEEGAGPKITELRDEGEGEDPSVEASAIESQELAVYKQHPRRGSLHGTVDIPLETYQADKEQVQRAIIAVLARHPSARAVFNEDTSTTSITSPTTSSTAPGSRRRLRRSTLTTDKSFDLRVIGEHEVLGEALDAHSSEAFDVHKGGPVRFVLASSTSDPSPKAMLRVVFHKAAIDLCSASMLVTDLTKCLESSDSAALVPASEQKAPDRAESDRLNQTLERLYHTNQSKIVHFWEPKLSEADHIKPSSLKFDRSDSGHGASEIGSLKVMVPPVVLHRLSNFILFHDVTVLGVIGSCYQVLLHSVTGEPSIPLVFPLDLRKMDLDLNPDTAANYCSDLPLIAHFGPSKMKASTMTLQNFVLANDRSMMSDIKHGVLPLSMFDPLADRLHHVFNACRHGVSIDILNDLNGYGAANGDASPASDLAAVFSKCKAKNAFKLRVSKGTAVMPRDLETNLMIQHHLHHGVLTLTLSYKRSVLDEVKAQSMLRALVFVVTRLMTHPDTSVRKMVRHGQKFKRQLAKQSKRAASAQNC